MQQHPVPQNVTQYQFRLVGDMTLKQFLELLGGILLAYLFYASNLVFIFKWPLALLSVFMGIALAFFPIEDRPLDQWVTNFLKSIYQPTRFIWKKTNKIPSFFNFSPAPAVTTNTITKTIKAPTLSAAPTPPSDLSTDESTRLAALDSLFQTLPPAPTINHEPLTINHKPTVSIRKLSSSPTVDLNFRSQSIVKATNNISSQPKDVVGSTIVFRAPTVNPAPPTPASAPAKTIALPASPKLPNLITGLVVSASGQMVDGAIVQILDSTGVPARALKTNSLGRFFTSTPLSPGTYTIEVDKTGFTFTPQTLIINNSVLPAIELRAT